MTTTKLCLIGLVVTTIFAVSEQALGQMPDFYSSPSFSNMISTMIDNKILQGSMGNYKGSPGSSQRSSSRASTNEVPAYRRYPAVQFKSTGTRVTLQEYLDSVNISPQDKAELKDLVLGIFNKYETEAAAKGYPNDWALAFVSYVGLNSHIYNGKIEKPIIPFEQNLGLRDLVAESATDHGIFNNVTDRKKQELYELLVMTAGLTYHFYEKAIRENNAEEIKNCKLSAENNLKLVGIRP